MVSYPNTYYTCAEYRGNLRGVVDFHVDIFWNESQDHCSIFFQRTNFQLKTASPLSSNSIQCRVVQGTVCFEIIFCFLSYYNIIIISQVQAALTVALLNWIVVVTLFHCPPLV